MLKHGKCIHVNLFTAVGIYLQLCATVQCLRCAYCATGKHGIGNGSTACRCSHSSRICNIRKGVGESSEQLKYCTFYTVYLGRELHKFTSS